jgi:soluble lytic murein transglycosylase-like protein
MIIIGYIVYNGVIINRYKNKIQQLNNTLIEYENTSKVITAELKEIYNIEQSIELLKPTILERDKIELATSIYKYSKLYNYDPNLMLSIGFIESSFNKKAISSANCRSIFQVNPAVHPVDINKIHNIDYNTKWGYLIFNDNMRKYKNNLVLALNGYNGWPSLRNPYATKVLAIYDKLNNNNS